MAGMCSRDCLQDSLEHTKKIVKEKERGRKIHAESIAGICCSV